MISIAKTKTEKCLDLLILNPDPSLKQIDVIAEQVGTTRRTVYRALERLHEANAKASQVSKRKSKSKKKKPGPAKVKAQPTPKAFQKAAATPKGTIPKITKKMTLEFFAKYHMYPDYDGLYRWQIDADKKIGINPFSQITVARDHGKSVYLTAKCEKRMSNGWDILYLGWTTRRKEIAQFVFTYFERRGEIIVDKTTSPFHFKTKLGTSFDTFSVKSKEVLGMHELGAQNREIVEGINEYLEDFVRTSDNKLLLVIDDPIDGTFRKERHKEKELEDFYDSTIMPINPNQTINVGTKKFEEDFFYYFKRKYGKDLIEIKSGPFLDPSDSRYNKEKDNPCNLLCPERWIWIDDPQYNAYLKLQDKIRMGVPIESLSKEDQLLARRRDLYKAKEQMDPFWYAAEYDQNPHPMTGDVWKAVKFVPVMKAIAEYHLLCITIDRATTTNKTSDLTGITVFLRHNNGNYLVIADYSRKIDITDLVPFIDNLYNEYMVAYGEAVIIKIVVEKQGGGDDFIALVKYLPWGWVCDENPQAGILIPVHNTRNKETRIKDILRVPINNGKIEFLDVLEHSELVEKEILVFPNQNKVDALDSLANGIHEMEQIPIFKETGREIRAAYKQKLKSLSHDNTSITDLIMNQSRGKTIFH